jgi:diguanylate cyclase (GGDEF)-like protein/PAS domain S-box-containing protein
LNLPLRSSLRLRVVLVILLTTAIALVMACAAFLAYEYASIRGQLVVRLAALASIAGESTKAALIFGDRGDAESSLAALREDPQILAAALYANDGRIFAHFSRAGETVSLPAEPPSGEAVFGSHHIALSSPILADDRRIGTLYLLSDLSTFEDQFRAFARAGGGVLLLALLVAALIAYRLQRIVADPVLDLVAAAKTVEAQQDYGVRVVPSGPDELGLLADSFNDMLGQIERRDASLRESEARYALAVRGARDGLWDWNLASGEIYFAPRFKEMLGFGESELEPRPEEWLDRIHPEDAAEFRAALDAHLKGETPHFEAEYRLRHRTGGWLWVFSRGVAVREPWGLAVRIAGSQTDVTERKGRDALTGLPNRILFVDRLEGALQREKRRSGYQFAVLALELDRLDLISETLGRTAGRELMVAAAERIQGRLSERDTLARLDGGVFGILLDDIGDAANASRKAAEFQTALATAFHIAEQDVFTTTATGIALSHSGYAHAEDLLRDAHAALSRARDRGTSQVEVFDEEIRLRAFARLELEDELRRAVERNALELHYQPIVALAGRNLAGFEALTRWPRAAGALTLPGEFIPLAEETGIIFGLGSWVLREGCRQLREWRAELPSMQELSLSINVSARQLSRPDLVDEVESALRECGVPAQCLKLEITESVLIESQEPVRTVLAGLRRLGVGVWLDDFGTGYSNLSYLHRFPVEALKIDRSFVTEIDGEAERRQVVGTLVALARSLGMKAVAEGVETERQLQRLATFGCDFVQGHAVSLPLNAAAAAALLRERSAGRGEA